MLTWRTDACRLQANALCKLIGCVDTPHCGGGIVQRRGIMCNQFASVAIMMYGRMSAVNH
jgi:hypothetical protein